MPQGEHAGEGRRRLPPMAWIPTPGPEGVGPELARLMRDHADPETGAVDEILRVHALDPDGLRAHLAVYQSAMRGTRGLRKVDRELVALVVSRLNGCHY
jgi:alkylhydroperoxidase family enzyme